MDDLSHAHRRRLAVCVGALMLGTCTTSFAESSRDGLWTDAPATPTAMSRGATNPSMPRHYRTLTLDTSRLALAVKNPGTSRSSSMQSIDMPLPEGGFTRFELSPSDVLPAGLASRFPHLRSMKGRDDSGRSIRLDTTANGVQALISDDAGSWLVQPMSTLTGASTNARGAPADSQYVVFRRKDAAQSDQSFSEDGMKATLESSSRAGVHNAPANARSGAQSLRTFRIAMTATSEYTKKLGGSVDDGMAGVVRTVNRVNQVFENDFGIHLVLAENNDRLILTDPTNDPFEEANNDPANKGDGDKDDAVMLANAKFTNDKLPQDAFDVGHVLDGYRKSGVVGNIGNTCIRYSPSMADPGLSKAAGMTGHFNPTGDAFHIDYVAHELGHQFGAPHTFAGCGGGGAAAGRLEPGSGSTIMGYAGICGAHNLQANSDPYFHAASIDAVAAWTTSAGGTCASARNNPTPVPYLQPQFNNIVIPARTPFALGEDASFADPSAKLTYTWEQMDPGPVQTWTTLYDTGIGPLFRSRAPTEENHRTFPALAVLINKGVPGKEQLGLGDALPTTNRILHFRATVRDNLDHRSTVAGADRYVRVHDTGAAFEVRTPKTSARLKSAREYATTWNVANTNKPPIECEKVDVNISVDGGHTFLEEPLLSEVPNNGRAKFTLPASIPDTTRARLRISCTSQPFFALSPADFTIHR